MPLIADRARGLIRDEYVPAGDYKAIAISNGPFAYVTNQESEDIAKTNALDLCQRRVDPARARKCELYAVGDTVVYARGRPPLPPPPWLTHDSSVEQPFSVDLVPLVPPNSRAFIAKNYTSGRKTRALVISAAGGFNFFLGQTSSDEAVRRSLEGCGSTYGVPCMAIAVDDTFVVPIPTTMKVTSFFRPESVAAMAPTARSTVTQRLTGATGWTAVAMGGSGRAGVGVRAANEQDAVSSAMADCSKQDHDCHVISIGPFSVESK